MPPHLSQGLFSGILILKQICPVKQTNLALSHFWQLDCAACVCVRLFSASLRPLCAIKAGVSKCDSALMDNDKVADELPQPFPSPVGARRSTV